MLTNMNFFFVSLNSLCESRIMRNVRVCCNSSLARVEYRSEDLQYVYSIYIYFEKSLNY